MKTDYGITLDKTREGVLLCNVMRSPICIHSFMAEPSEKGYRLYEMISKDERIERGLVEGEPTAKLNLSMMAQQFILGYTRIRGK